MKLRNNKWKLKSDLELTPLVDIVFLLLLFFAISSSFIQRPGIRVNLPLSHFMWGEEQERIFATLTYDNILFIDQRKVDWEEFPEVLQGKVLKMHNPIFIIHADEKVPHGQVVKIMDMAKETGISTIAIATKPPE